MNMPQPLMQYLKQRGASSIKDLVEGLELSETAVRHQLSLLEQNGWLTQQQRREGRGRPAIVYGLSQLAESAFPKRYPELLHAVLTQAETEGWLERLLEGVAENMASDLRRKLEGLQGQAKLNALLEHMDYGDMLGVLEETPTSYQLSAYNCLYHATGKRFERVCDLPAQVIGKATGMSVHRPYCQRDGKLACHFVIDK